VSSTRRAFYDVAIDGGAIGVHVMRAGFIRPRDLIVMTHVVVLAAFAFGVGATLDIGWTSNPAGLIVGEDPQYFGPPPESDVNLYGSVLPNLAGWESIVLRVNSAALTAGQLELLLEVESY
jgi:hypothetical protein